MTWRRPAVCENYQIDPIALFFIFSHEKKNYTTFKDFLHPHEPCGVITFVWVLRQIENRSGHVSYQGSFESIPELWSTKFRVRSSTSSGSEIFDATEAVVILKHVLQQFLLKLIVLLHGIQSRFNFLCWRLFRRRFVALQKVEITRGDKHAVSIPRISNIKGLVFIRPSHLEHFLQFFRCPTRCEK